MVSESLVGLSSLWSGSKGGDQALWGLLLGLTHAGQKNWVSLVLYNIERTCLQVLGHGGDFIKFPGIDFREEAAELPDLLGKTEAQKWT